MMGQNCIAILLVFLAGSIASASGENWNGWRGPRGDGTSLEKNVPTQWNVEHKHNIAWQVAVAGTGHASPIVWNNKIFLVSCLKESHERVLICVDRETGATLWTRTALQSPLESKHGLNSYASGTPATDGQSIFATFLAVTGENVPAPNVGTSRMITAGQLIVVSYDFEGKERWRAKPGPFISAHGLCSSPIIYQNTVIINGDHDGDGYIVALDRTSGEVRWKVERDHHTRSYVTPLIRNLGGRTQMILSGSEHVASYDPKTGERYWKIQGPTEQFVASMVTDDNLVFLTAGYPEYHILAIRPDGHGDVTDTHIAWRTRRGAAYVPSPIVAGTYLLVISDGGIASCFDSATGNRFWMKRLGPRYSSSLVSANGLVYFLSDEGVITVIRPGPEFEVVAENKLGENCYASPAISQGCIYIRGEKNLYSIRDRQVSLQ